MQEGGGRGLARRVRLATWLWWFLTIPAGLGLGVVLVKSARSSAELAQHRDLLVQVELTVLVLIPLLVASVVVHELGHAAADRLLGFRVLVIRLGPLRFARASEGWLMTVDRSQLSLRGPLRARVHSDPVSPDHLRVRHALGVAAGPAAGLLLAAIVGALGVRSTSLPLVIGAACAGLFAAAELLPNRPAGADRTWSDGAWLLCWLREPERAVQRLAVGALQLAQARRERPRSWDRRWTRLAAAGAETPSTADELRGCQLAYYAALDRGEHAEASRLAERLYAGRNLARAAAHPLLILELAFCRARLDADLDAARRLLDEARNQVGPVPVADLGRAEAALHLAAGRPDEALATCERVLADAPALGRATHGLAVVARGQLEAIRQEAGDRAGRRQAIP
jgi:hypothetical protein